MERVKGIEPSSQPWEGHILPLNHTRFAHDRQLDHGSRRYFIKLFFRCNR